MASILMAIILAIVPAVNTCQNQTNTTTPTWSQCMANQFEQNGDN